MALNILVYVSSRFFSCFLVRVQASDPYNKTDSTTALEKVLFNVLLSCDFYIDLNFSRSVLDLAIIIFISLSIDSISL